MSENAEALIIIKDDAILAGINKEMLEFDKREDEKLLFFKKMVENEKNKLDEEKKAIWRSFEQRLKELNLLPANYDLKDSKHFLSLRDGVIYKIEKKSRQDPISELIKMLIKD